MIVLTFINVISSLAMCLCAGAMLNIREEIKDRIDELSMIECQVIRHLPEEAEEDSKNEV